MTSQPGFGTGSGTDRPTLRVGAGDDMGAARGGYFGPGDKHTIVDARLFGNGKKKFDQYTMSGLSTQPLGSRTM